MSSVNIVYDEVNNKYIAQPKIENSAGGSSAVSLLDLNKTGVCYSVSSIYQDYDGSTAGSSAKDFMSFYNPTGSGKNVYIHNISAIKSTNNTSEMTFRIHKLTGTPTSGTDLSSVNMNFSSVNTSIIEAKYIPTMAYDDTIEIDTFLVSSDTTHHFSNDLREMIILPPNTGIALTCFYGSSNIEHKLTIKYYEEDI